MGEPPHVRIGPAELTDVRTGKAIGLLAPGLLPYLDHALYFRDDGPFCNQKDCPGCKARPGLDEVHFAPRHRMTVRELLAAVQAHVEEVQ